MIWRAPRAHYEVVLDTMSVNDMVMSPALLRVSVGSLRLSVLVKSTTIDEPACANVKSARTTSTTNRHFERRRLERALKQIVDDDKAHDAAGGDVDGDDLVSRNLALGHVAEIRLCAIMRAQNIQARPIDRHPEKDCAPALMRGTSRYCVDEIEALSRAPDNFQLGSKCQP